MFSTGCNTVTNKEKAVVEGQWQRVFNADVPGNISQRRLECALSHGCSAATKTNRVLLIALCAVYIIYLLLDNPLRYTRNIILLVIKKNIQEGLS